jgi:carboxyl-terminal processing protease
MRRFLVFVLFFSLCLGFQSAAGSQDFDNYDSNRARLLGYILKHELETLHFSHKTIDENLSRAAFSLYLKRLDGQKRLLLSGDVETLKAYSGMIGYELSIGKMETPVRATELLIARVNQVRQMVRDILSSDFDFAKEESIEIDNEKIDYCPTLDALRDRWRKILKFQVLNRYLMMEEEASSSISSDPDRANKTSPKNLQETARTKIAKNYEEVFSRMLQEKESERFDRYFDAVARAFDPHTAYMPPENKEDFDISMRGSLEGIGATLQEEEGYIKVMSVVPGGPAFRQGQLHAGDFILKVGEGNNDPVDITYMSVKDAVRLIRGKKGTEVKLTVKKPGGQIIIPIVRDVVQIEETFAKGTTLKDEKNGQIFGYIKIPSFYRDFEKTRIGGNGRNCSDDVRAELKKIVSQKIGGLILDLRNNGGGALADAVKIAGLFIKTGPVVQIKDSTGKIEILSDDDPVTNYDGPLVVLVNKFSASASEILAGALQDYGRAVIIGGEHTHGKGTVQSIIDLNEEIPFENMDKYDSTLGALRITIQKFYRITGESTQYKGVVPDIVLPDKFESVKSGEKFLDFALPWDTVDPAKFSKWSKFKIDIRDLKLKSAGRVLSDEIFASIISENKIIAIQKNKSLQSLNIDAVRKEHAESKGRSELTDRNPHDDMGPDLKTSTLLNEKEKADLLAKAANADAYVQEAISVLKDIISANPDHSLNQVHRTMLIPTLSNRLIPARNPFFGKNDLPGVVIAKQGMIHDTSQMGDVISHE